MESLIQEGEEDESESVGIGASEGWKHKEGMAIDWQKTERGKSQWGGGEQETKNRTFRRRSWGKKEGEPQKTR